METDAITGDLRLCKRCLTREMAGQEETFRNLREYIENLDSNIRTKASVYEERLNICKECELLFQGMCRTCGCYVELRAAVAGNSCPNKKWRQV